MALSRVYVLCATTVVLTVVKVHTAPVGGMLSGLFGGDDGSPRQAAAPVDINQLLRQYYAQQSDNQPAQYNPYGQFGAPINYGQAPYNPYPSIDPLMQSYQQSNFNPGYGDPYGQMAPLYRGGQNVPNSADDSVAADHYGKQLDSLLTNGNDAAQYRSLSNPASAEGQPPAAPQVDARLDASQSDSPVASSLVVPRVLQDSSSASQLASSSNSAKEGNVEDQQ